MNRGNEDKAPDAVNERASDAFVRRTVGDWTTEEQREFEVRLANDSAYASAFHGMEKSWRSIGVHAESPELMKLRESAIAWARRENRKRWSDTPRERRKVLAICAGLATVAMAIGFQLSPYGYHPGLYQTGMGQQTKVDLADQSQVELDAATRIRVRFTETERTVRLLEGQAQFSVAKDPSRPFRVLAGDQTIVALGTVFTVEYIDRKLHVATLEGKVAISSVPDSMGTGAGRPGEVTQTPVTLTAGEELRVASNGKVEFVPKAEADLAAATAWRQGNVVFRDEPLGDAVRRLNRYSRSKLKITDPALATLRISGVFQKGDSAAFARSVQAYYPVVADESDGESIHLRVK